MEKRIGNAFRERKGCLRRVLAAVLCMAVAVTAALAGVPAVKVQAAESGGTVTRLAWLKALTQTFEMSVEEDNYPDNYYTDIDAASPDYYDVMLATEFGLVDVEAGGELRPQDAATREFAAHTLNLCLGYALKEETYTFAEAADVAYPSDIQIAVNEGWLALADGKFLPEQAVTEEEKERMIASAKAVYASGKEVTGDNTYVYKDNVVLLPEDTRIETLEEGKIAIADCPVSIKAGDIFGMVYEGLPLAWRALGVQTDGGQTVVTVESAACEEAFDSINISQEMEADLTRVEAVSENATLRYVVGGTEENNYEDGTVFSTLEEVKGEEVNAVVIEEVIDAPKGLDLEVGAAKISFDVWITNLSQTHQWKGNEKYVDVSFDASFHCNVDFDVLSAAGIAPSVDLFRLDPFPGIYVKGTLDLSFSGEIEFDLSEHITLGVHCQKNRPARFVKNFVKKSFTIRGEVKLRAGMNVEAGFDILGVKGCIYGKTGIQINVSAKKYTDGKTPSSCQTVTSFLYASIGYKLTVDWVVYKDTLAEGKMIIYSADSSPIRLCVHYEDGVHVAKCARQSYGMGYGGGGYFSPVNSQYYYDGSSSGVGFGDGTVYTIFDYTLNEDNHATITGYHGTAVNVYIPETLDGYMVIGIGDRAFQNNKRIRSVSMADSVQTMGDYAFAGCTALERVTFPENEKFVTIALRAFDGCVRLRGVEIPDTVTVIEGYAFRGCTNLKEVLFSKNLTEIYEYAFLDCKSLKRVDIPDSVTKINQGAFYECEILSEVILPKRLEEMGSQVFYNCDKITKIEIPKSLKAGGSWYGSGPFGSCDGLKEVIFEEGTTEIAYYLFDGCTGLEKITIPDTVTVIEGYAFRGCTNLKEVLFSKNLTEIYEYAFLDCKSLKRVDIPDSVTKINKGAFYECDSLTEAIIPDSVISIGNDTFSGCTSLQKVHIPNIQKSIVQNMFYNCTGLSEINLPDTLTEISNSAFYNCDALTELQLPAQLQKIGANAFYDCDALTKVTMPGTVISLGDHAFYHCDTLAEVSLGSGLTSLPDYVFAQCPALTKIVLPYRMTKLNDNAFNACVGLVEVTMPKSLASIGSQTFSYPGKMTIYGIGGTYAETYAKENGITFVNREVNAQSAALNLTELRLGKGHSRQLFLTASPEEFTDEVSWKSGDTGIATVAGDGTVKAVACGTTIIKVNVGNASASCNVTVYQPVTSIRLSKSSAELAAGDTLELTATVNPKDATNKEYRWSSSDSAVASVSESGLVTALAKGEATITATAADGSGVTASCTVNVTTQLVKVTDVRDLQSPHPYENNCSDSWFYTLPGAAGLSVVFDEKTEMEGGFDYIHLYGKNNKLVGTYTGKGLAGKMVYVAGDTVRIKLETDQGGNAYGFAVKSVTEASGMQTPESEKIDTQGTEKPGVLNSETSSSQASNTENAGTSNPGTSGSQVQDSENPGTPDTQKPAQKPVKKPSVSKVKSFQIKPGKKKLAMSWKKISGAAGYQLQVSTKKNFIGAKTISISKSKKTYTKNGLKAKRKYYVRIRAYKTYKDAKGRSQKAYGKWATGNKKTK